MHMQWWQRNFHVELTSNWIRGRAATKDSFDHQSNKACEFPIVVSLFVLLWAFFRLLHVCPLHRYHYHPSLPHPLLAIPARTPSLRFGKWSLLGNPALRLADCIYRRISIEWHSHFHHVYNDNKDPTPFSWSSEYHLWLTNVVYHGLFTELILDPNLFHRVLRQHGVLHSTHQFIKSVSRSETIPGSIHLDHSSVLLASPLDC